MPEPLKSFAMVNPITIVVDAMRSLWLGAPSKNYIWEAVVWCFVILAIFAPLAVARYRKAAGRS
jgi:ABC-2 type transport system permease protein/oleandomycin transport system permease protein